jgi:hypothetical protein
MLYALLVFCAVLLSLLRPARGGSIMVTAGGTHPVPTFHWADINGVKKAHRLRRQVDGIRMVERRER